MKEIKGLLWCKLFFLLSCIFSCQVKRPSYILSESRMENILYDYHIAKAMGEEVPYSESYKRVLYIESVFEKHGITKADFDTSMVWYTRNPDVLFKVYEQVNVRLRTERDRINQQIELRVDRPSSTVSGDSIDIWFWQRSYLLTGAELDNKLLFVLPSDSNFKQRDTLRWNAFFNFMNYTPDSMHAPVISMQLLYRDEDVKSKQLRVYRQGSVELSLMLDTLKELKEIRGFIYTPTKESHNQLLVNNIALMRYHARDSLLMESGDSLQHSSTEQLDDIPEMNDTLILKEEETNSQIKEGRDERMRRIPPRPRPVLQDSVLKPK